MPDLWTVSGIAIVVLLYAVIYVWYRWKLSDAQKLLILAKTETREVAQIPLNNPHPILQINRNGDIVYANTTAQNAFPDLNAADGKQAILGGVDIFWRMGGGDREITYSDKAYAQNCMLSSMAGEETMLIYCYDITALKRSEMKLKQAYETAEKARAIAEKAKDARGQFLANMSHELRTPMSGIIGISDILCEAPMPHDQKDLVEAVNTSSRNLLILLNDILDFSKIEAGELALETIPFDLTKVIAQVEKLHMTVASRKELSLKCEIQKDVPHFVKGDPTRLQQILNNLIGNAIKFTDSGSVTIATSLKEDRKDHAVIEIAVQDTGIGIPKDRQDKIFEKFQQADESTARKYGGTGLGLAITKDLVTLMKGTIRIESEEGKGTAFIITLPLERAYAEEAAAEKASFDKNAISGINKNARILIVDDHPVNLLFMRQVMKRFGFQHCDEASDGKQAIALYKENHYDLVLMDCQMPHMSGFEAARIMRADKDCRSVIIAITADISQGIEDKCNETGMNAYISKPVDQDKLLSIFQKWIPGENDLMFEETSMQNNTKPSPSDNSIMFDWDLFNSFTDGDQELHNELITLFIDNLIIDLDAMKDYLDRQDYENWERVAHKISGACSHIGARSMAQICRDAEAVPLDEPEKISEMHQIILDQYKVLHDHLREQYAA